MSGLGSVSLLKYTTDIVKMPINFNENMCQVMVN